MADAVFPFPGGKSRFASWILDQTPEHTCFVEVFGGAAGVLANKDPDTSDVEVYNDHDSDLVQFFEVLRDCCDELVDALTKFEYDWIWLYEDLPEEFEYVYMLDHDEKRFINSGKRG